MSKKLRELLTKRDAIDTDMGTLSDRGGELAAADDQTDELRTEFTGIGEKLKAKRADKAVLSELIASEREADETRQAAAAARFGRLTCRVSTPKPASASELRSKVASAAYVAGGNRTAGRAGAEAEFNAACNIAGNSFPLELLAPPNSASPERKNRATTGVDTMTVTPRRWLDRLFAGTASAKPSASQWKALSQASPHSP